MAVLDCREAAKSLKTDIQNTVLRLKENCISPKLGIVRVGERPEDISYEKGILKNCTAMGIEVEVFELPSDVGYDGFIHKLSEINNDEKIHGILIFRPLPEDIPEDKVKHLINPEKDVDCMNPRNLARIFEGDMSGFAPCTPSAVMEIIKYFGIDINGKSTTVIGRSMVVGKPLSMMLLKENATVTICHSRTKDIKEIVSRADVVISAIGRAKAIDASYIKPGAVVIDVGVNENPEGGICGDVDFESVKEIASRITPVPGGVGAVTTLMLLKHVAAAAQNIGAAQL